MIDNTIAVIVGRLREMLETGGPVVGVLAALSIAATAIVLVKLVQFRSVRLGDRRTSLEAIELWRAGRHGDALATAARSPNPVAQTLARAMRGRELGLDDALVREEAARHGGEVLAALRGWLRPLEVIAALAPLLGLLGTVLGMIEAFRALEAAGSQVDPATLSGGIWEALLTTAIGLAVAIPVVAVLGWLERRVDRTAEAMESIVTRVFTPDLTPEPARTTWTPSTWTPGHQENDPCSRALRPGPGRQAGPAGAGP